MFTKTSQNNTIRLKMWICAFSKHIVAYVTQNSLSIFLCTCSLIVLNFIVEFTNFVSRVWAQIVERVVVQFHWNFNTIIWNLYVFIFATWKNFPITGDFPRAEKRENEAVFLTLQKTVNLYDFFYVMKVMGKILWGVFLIGRIVNFNFHPFLEFSDFRFERY